MPLTRPADRLRNATYRPSGLNTGDCDTFWPVAVPPELMLTTDIAPVSMFLKNTSDPVVSAIPSTRFVAWLTNARYFPSALNTGRSTGDPALPVEVPAVLCEITDVTPV